jgi:hypothetical protein
MEIADGNFGTPLRGSLTRGFDFHVQRNLEFRTRFWIAGFDFRGLIQRMSSESGVWHSRGVIVRNVSIYILVRTVAWHPNWTYRLANEKSH